MSPWEAKVNDASSPEQIAYWASLRTLGRSYYLRASVLFWASFAVGLGCFLDLLYHFARFGVWRIGTVWIGITVLAILITVAIYSKRWDVNERRFKIYAQQGAPSDAP